MNKAMKEHQRSLSPSLSLDGRKHSNDATRNLALHFSEKHRLLQLRLKPLTTIQGDLEEYLCSVLEPVQVGTALHTTFPSPDAESPSDSRRHMRFSASGNSSWRSRFSSEKPKGPTGRRVIRDLDDIIEVLYCCGSDIQQLWADDAVLRAVKGAKEHSELSVSNLAPVAAPLIPILLALGRISIASCRGITYLLMRMWSKPSSRPSVFRSITSASLAGPRVCTRSSVTGCRPPV